MSEMQHDHSSDRLRRTARLAALWGGVALAQFAVYRVGLLLAVGGSESVWLPLWLPAGTALAALLLFGVRAWPGVLAGALAGDLSIGLPLYAAVPIAIGNALEAAAGAVLLRRLVGHAYPFTRVAELAVFVIVIFFTSFVVSATIGTTSLTLAGLSSWAGYSKAWLTWGMGSWSGALVAAPLVLSLARAGRREWTWESLLELSLIGLLAALCVQAVFGDWMLPPELARPLVFIVLPLIIVGSLRLADGAAPVLTAVVSVGAVLYTAHGSGPFAVPGGGSSLVLLEIFVAVTGLTALLVAAIAAEREASRRAVQASRDDLEGRVRERTRALRTANQRLEQEVAARIREGESLRKLSSIAEHTSDLVYVTDVDGVIEYVNTGFELVTGYTRDQIIGKRPSVLKSGQHDDEFYRDMWRTLLDGKRFHAEMVNRKADGSHYHEEKTILPLRDESGCITHFVATGKDITEQVRTRRKLDHLAFHDQLTGLPNRALFRDRLEQAMGRAGRENQLVALMFLDLDRFKNINDTLGHSTGDRLLVQVAERLQSCVRKTDTVARLGGDEFTVVMEQVSHIDQAAAVAQKILESLSQRFEIGSSVLRVTSSIGIAVWPWDDQDADDLIRDADVAMYHAKDHGRNKYEFYSAEMSARVAQHVALEAELDRAFERGEFTVHYQPIVDLASGRVHACEALLRWQHPERGLVLPGEFVPALEESGRIVALTQWVLGELGHQQRQLDDAGLSDVALAVNFTASCFAVPEMLACVRGVFEASGLDPARVIMEVTESVLIDNSRQPVELIRGLKDMGVTVALDDFGTGQSSLSHLRRFAIDVVKIDRDFVRDVPGDSKDAELVAAIIAMAHNLNKRVVAEGVETAEQLAFLSSYQCEAVQGWLFARALPGTELVSLLRDSGGRLTAQRGEAQAPCAHTPACGCGECDAETGADAGKDVPDAHPARVSTAPPENA